MWRIILVVFFTTICLLINEDGAMQSKKKMVVALPKRKRQKEASNKSLSSTGTSSSDDPEYIDEIVRQLKGKCKSTPGASSSKKPRQKEQRPKMVLQKLKSFQQYNTSSSSSSTEFVESEDESSDEKKRGQKKKWPMLQKSKSLKQTKRKASESSDQEIVGTSKRRKGPAGGASQTTKLDDAFMKQIDEWLETLDIDKLKRKNGKTKRGGRNDILSFTNDTVTTYEILKMAKKLGDIEDEKAFDKKSAKNGHHFFVDQSDPKIFTKILKSFKCLKSQNKRKEKLINKKKKEFCVLAHFVKEKIEEIGEENQIPMEEEEEEKEGMTENEKNKRQSEKSIGVTIGRFILAREKFCKSEEFELETTLQEHLLYIIKAITTEYEPHENLLQIIPVIIAQIEKMLQICDWNFVNFNYTYILEWNLLKYYLNKNGESQKWEEMDKMRKEWETLFNEWYFEKEKDSEETVVKMKEVIGNMIGKLRGIH